MDAKKRQKKPQRLWALMAYLIAALVIGGQRWDAVDPAASSTAALAYFFIPFYAAINAIPFAIMGYAVGMLLLARKSRERKHVLIGAITSALSIVYITYLIVYAVSERRWAETVAQVGLLDDAGLSAFLDIHPHRNNRYALGAVAANLAASANTLARVAALDDPSLHESYGCGHKVDLCGENREGRAVMVKVAYHPNLGASTLPRLAQSSNAYVLAAVAGNPSASKTVLEEIFRERAKFSSLRYRIDGGLASNEVTPEHILRALAFDSESDDGTLLGIVRNASAPIDLKKHAMARVDRCEYRDNDYPFTPCVPNSTKWENIESNAANAPIQTAIKGNLASCRLEKESRSLGGGGPVKVKFSNTFGEAIRIYWIDYQGNREYYNTLPPGASNTQQTYEGHPWVVTYATGDCLGLYFPKAETRR